MSLERLADLVMLVPLVFKELKVFLARMVSTGLVVILVSMALLVWPVFLDQLDRRAIQDQRETKVMLVSLVLLVLSIIEVLKVTWVLLVNLDHVVMLHGDPDKAFKETEHKIESTVRM